MKRVLSWIILMAIGLEPHLLYGKGIEKKVRKGNKLFKQGKYDDAIAKYTDAQVDLPESAELYFNIGDGLYKQRKFKEAEQMFEKALPGADTSLEAKIYYNIGNCKYKQGQLRDALEYYKKALELNPDDKDAKYNIEFVERKLRELLSKLKSTLQKQKQKQQQMQTAKQKQQTATGAEGKEEKKEGIQQKGEKTEGRQEKEEKGEREGLKAGEETGKKEKLEQEKKEEKGEEEKKQQERVGFKKGSQEKREIDKQQAEALLQMIGHEEKNRRMFQKRPRRGGYYESEKPW